jgi:hypothetical protein
VREAGYRGGAWGRGSGSCKILNLSGPTTFTSRQFGCMEWAGRFAATKAFTPICVRCSVTACNSAALRFQNSSAEGISATIWALS